MSGLYPLFQSDCSETSGNNTIHPAPETFILFKSASSFSFEIDEFPIGKCG